MTACPSQGKAAMRCRPSCGWSVAPACGAQKVPYDARGHRSAHHQAFQHTTGVEQRGMKVRDAYRDSFDPTARALGWSRMRLLVVNAVAISAFPILSKIAESKPLMDGPELSGVVSSLAFYSAINLSVEITRRILGRMATLGRIDLALVMFALVLMTFFTAIDTWWQAAYKMSFLEASAPYILFASVLLSFASE